MLPSASRVRFIKVFGLGDQQANAVYNAVKQGLEKYGENMTLADFGNELRALGGQPAAGTNGPCATRAPD